MTNREIAAVLFNISKLLSLRHDNPYRIRAYRRAARRVLRAPHALAERARRGEPLGIAGLGRRLTRTISQLALQGRCDVYDELLGELPAAEQRLLRIPGIGPTLAQRIVRDFKTTDADELMRRAASAGLQRVWGIGPRRAATIVAHLQQPPAPPEAHPFVRDGNIIYVQESFWHEERQRREAA
ncbi:helix-hairpin-helix domain-containing protein [Kallotenue papyrolyticum]|uniref:helix-hairpin-helix domain-containing protein n=1 Tax=Kallotenue papyrolyticum TaxID=1325125 RepID=UPI00049278EF|nr:helix-hairpin-helix domain-containing protein [Kallotenue papyrolyticum]